MKDRKRSFLPVLASIAGLSLLIAGCEDYPPVKAKQNGFRGVGMEQVSNPRRLAKSKIQNQMPEPLERFEAEGDLASQVYENVQVLGDLRETEFLRLMTAITQWVSPEQGCTYCHTDNLAEDKVYTKVVARRMLQMTKTINSKWDKHVGKTGVTCYTCHRGHPVPKEVWHKDPGPKQAKGMTASSAGQNIAAKSVGVTSLPYDPFYELLLKDNEIRIASSSALPTDNMRNIKDTELTYGLMMHMSDSLGQNCTFCHNSRAFSAWEESRPQRTTAWHGIRMAQELNNKYLEPLKENFPANRLGPLGDTLKVNCGTCHQGVHKPMYGAQMLKDYPELDKVK